MIGVRVSDRNNDTSYTEKYQKRKHIPCSFIKLCVLIINLVNQLFFTGEKWNQ